jgi:two-component system nitrogen regulation response regulator GlnG
MAAPAGAEAQGVAGGVPMPAFAGAAVPPAVAVADAYSEPVGGHVGFGAPPAFGAMPGAGIGYPTADAGFAAHDGAARAAPAARVGWAALLESEVAQMLTAQSARGGEPPASSDVMDQLTRMFESTIIRTALRHTRGRRIDAALRLGIGRNTITRKIQDLHLEDD